MLSETLRMYDVAKEIGGTPPTVTYHRGTRQIDGTWATDNLSITGAYFLPFLSRVGDHRSILLDIPVDKIIGEHGKVIARPQVRRLQIWNLGIK